MFWLSKMKSRDNYISQHSLNVCLLAINFGRHLGAQEDELTKLGICALLHDVGKVKLPTRLLQKVEPLTEKEEVIFKKHPILGRDILLAQKNLYNGAVDVAYAHHEHMDGSGYPRGIDAGGIGDFTRIVSICDKYDALTSDRPASTGRSSRRALRFIYDHSGSMFDKRLVHLFIECIGLYPSGSLVELKNGSVGLVVGTNHRHRHLPKVLLLTDEHKRRQTEKVLILEKLVNDKQSNQLIARVLPNGSFGFRLEHYIEKGLQIN